jgi:LytR cell envelope-related transcriptional attenuator
VNLHVKTLLTLAILVVLLAAGIVWGWSAMTSPLPEKVQTKDCYPTVVQPGDRVSAPQVTVSVFNASDRVGLAERTMTGFEDQGFGPGAVGNAPQDVHVLFAQVWAKDRSDPAVQLVVSRLGPRAHVITARHHGGAGVVVMVGPRFGKLVAGRSSIKVRSTATICSPPTP